MCSSIYAFLVDECTRPSMTVKHFEASLALQAEDSVEVIYRIPFLQMTNFRYNRMLLTDESCLEGYDFTYIVIEDDTIDGLYAFE